MPKVTVKTGKGAWSVLLLGCIASLAGGQQPDSPQTPGPAEALYLKLRTVGLDKTRVYKVREASLDRANLHISLEDGTIAFTEDVGGHVTGAFYKGYGEVLLSPPNTMERASLALFTRAAILEETFSTAYFRFNDEVYGELQPWLRTADDPAAFAAEWDITARTLAAEDALRLLVTFSDSLPSVDQGPVPQANDHLLHVFLEGNRLGTFDVRYDSLLFEQIQAGQHKRIEGQGYYDVWTSFSVPSLPSSKAERGAVEASNFGFDVSHFKIEAEIKPSNEVAAKAVLGVVARQEGRRALLFELSRLMQVKEVRANRLPVEFIHNQAIEGSQLARRGNDVLAVILPSPLRAGQKIELSFVYSGSVLSEAANGLLYVGERGTWYPNRGFSPAWFDMEFRYPPGWTLVATGRRSEERTVGTQQVSKWRSERPVPVAGFNLGKYSENVTHAGTVAVLTYATATVERGFAGSTTHQEPEIPSFVRPQAPGTLLKFAVPPPLPTPSENAQMVGTVSAKALEFYARHFGAFPFSELAITQMPGRVSQGWPGLIFLSSYLFLSPQQQEQLQLGSGRQLASEQVIAHETAHQWWGDLVTWNSYRDQWIMEGLANYSALMLLESQDPSKFHHMMQNYRDELVAKTRKGRPLMDAGPVTLGLRLSSSQFPDAYNTICYGRGTWLFHMLRTMMRDGERKSSPGGARSKSNEEPFLRALKKLRTDYEGRDVSTSELMKIFEAELPPSLWYEGHKSLDWFYQSWVNGSAVPQLELRGLKFADQGSTTVVTGTIMQKHAPDNLITSVPLFSPGAGKNIFLARVFAEGQETQFHVSAPAGTRKLVLDPEQTLLARGK